MKTGIAIVKQAMYRLAERASGLGDPSGAEKERFLTIMRERDDLRKEDASDKKRLWICLMPGLLTLMKN